LIRLIAATEKLQVRISLAFAIGRYWRAVPVVMAGRIGVT
jgi:hypothetical protein